MVAQLYKFTKNHHVIHLKQVNFMFHKLYSTKAVVKNTHIHVK